MKTRILAALVVCLGVVGCGGSTHHQKPNPFTVEKIVQPHAIASPVPQPGQRMPAAVVPVPVPTKARATATANHAAVVSYVAAKVRPHIAGARVHFSGDTSTATVEQFDSVTLSTVPSWAHYVAGYTNGSYQTYRAMLGRWPIVVGISVHQNHQDGGADCLDMEPGNPGPDAAGPWVVWQHAQGNARPCLYSMLSWFPQIRASLAAYHVARSSVRLWDANWTYSRHLDSGYDCTQWTDRAYSLNLDESTCLLSFYGTPKPVGPSRSSVDRWAHARAASIASYRRHRCSRPVLTNGTCGQLGWRVNHYQALLDKTGKQVWRCFGKYARKTAAICQIVRSAVAVWSHARSSTAAAAFGLGCQGIATWGLPKSSPACRSLNQRYRYFDHRANRTVATSRY